MSEVHDPTAGLEIISIAKGVDLVQVFNNPRLTDRHKLLLTVVSVFGDNGSMPKRVLTDMTIGFVDMFGSERKALEAILDAARKVSN